MRRTAMLALLLCAIPTVSCAGLPDYFFRQGTVRYAIGLPDGQAVTLDNVLIQETAPPYLFVRDPWSTEPVLPVHVGETGLAKWQSVDVSGVMRTVDGQRVLVAETAALYVDSRGRPHIMLPKWTRVPWQWPYTLSIPLRPAPTQLPAPVLPVLPAEEQLQMLPDVTATTIGEAKRLAPLETVELTGKVVTAVLKNSNGYLDFIYIEEPDGSSGIRVYPDESELDLGTRVGDIVDITGLIEASDGFSNKGECLLWTEQFANHGPAESLPRQVGMPGRALAGGDLVLQEPLLYRVDGEAPNKTYTLGTGPNPVGLRVKTWGRVTSSLTVAGQQAYFIDDGSGLTCTLDGAVRHGICIIYPYGYPPDQQYGVGDYIAGVGGVLGAMRDDDAKPIPLLRITPPARPVVDDGTYVEMNGSGQATLHAQWTFDDPDNGASGDYQYAVGTVPGWDDVTGGWVTTTSTSASVNVTVTDLSATYYFSVKARSRMKMWSDAGISDGVKPVQFTGSGWSLSDWNTISYAGNGAVGSAEIRYSVQHNGSGQPLKEYEYCYSVHSTADRPLNGDWPTPRFELDVNGVTSQSGRFFGRSVDDKRDRRVRFFVTEDNENGPATVRFVSDAASTAPVTMDDFSFREVDSITQRDNTLGIPCKGYNLRVPPGGGIVDGWTSGYDDESFQDWLETVKREGQGLMVRVFMEMDQGMHTFHDDTWRIYPDTTGTPNVNLQYSDDWTLADGTVPQGHQFPWVTQAGSGYDSAYGFLESYKTRVHQFLSTCDESNVKVIAVLFSGGAFWENVPEKYIGNQWVRARCFRKTVFDKSTDTLSYHDIGSHPKYSSAQAQDHTDMFNNYVLAVKDWLGEFGEHESLWGIDVMNEPSQLGHTGPDITPDGRRRYCWHALGWDAADGDATSENHRMREFLEKAYLEVDAYRTQRDIKVISDVAWMDYHYPKQYIDMTHPWDEDATTVHRVCDVFGLHSYPYHNQEDMVNGVPQLSYTNMWCSDRLQNWRCPEEGVRDPNPFPHPVTDWMAEKPIILSETCRYVSYGTLAGEDGGMLFDDDEWCLAHNIPDNASWYHDYLDSTRGRHIESMIFWSGDGYSKTAHLVLGDSLAPDPLPDDYTYGWSSPYTLGSAGVTIYDHLE